MDTVSNFFKILARRCLARCREAAAPRAKRAARLLPPHRGQHIFNDIFLNVKMGRNVRQQNSAPENALLSLHNPVAVARAARALAGRYTASNRAATQRASEPLHSEQASRAAHEGLYWFSKCERGKTSARAGRRL